MCKLAFFLFGTFLLGSQVFAANQPVNIVYPIMGASYSNYFTSSFSVTCPGGEYSVEWGFDVTSVGKARYYDQATVQFTSKLPPGGHILWVKTSCGGDRVKFEII